MTDLEILTILSLSFFFGFFGGYAFAAIMDAICWRLQRRDQ